MMAHGALTDNHLTNSLVGFFGETLWGDPAVLVSGESLRENNLGRLSGKTLLLAHNLTMHMMQSERIL